MIFSIIENQKQHLKWTNSIPPHKVYNGSNVPLGNGNLDQEAG